MPLIQIEKIDPDQIERTYDFLGWSSEPEVIDKVVSAVESSDANYSSLLAGDSPSGILCQSVEKENFEEVTAAINDEGFTRIVALSSGSLSNRPFPYIQFVLRHSSVDRIDFIEDGLSITDLPGSDDRPGSELVGTACSGRPPLGFRAENGYLERSENFDQVIRVLHECDGDRSYRSGAKELGCGRKTIRDIVNDPDRRELYDLDPIW